MPNGNQQTNSSSVSFTITVNGSAIPASFNVASLIVYHAVNRISFARLMMLDGDPASGDFPISNMPEFVPGNDIEIAAGYDGDETILFKGIVVKHGIQLKGNNTSLLVIDARHTAVKMTKHKKSRIVTEQKDSDLFSTLVQEHGITVDAEDTGFSHAEMVQYNATDWDMAVCRAEANGMVVLCTTDGLSIQKPALASEAQLTLHYGANLFEMQVEMDARNTNEAVTFSGWNMGSLAMVEGEGTAPAGWTEPGNLSIGDLAAATGAAKSLIATPATMPEAEMTNLASGRLLLHQLSKVRGSARCQGSAVLLPGAMVTLQGVGERFEGKHFVSAVRHEFNQGSWFSNVEWGLVPELFMQQHAVNELPAQAILPAVQGLHTGIVTQLQDDPLGEDRILVKMPAIDGSADGVWARQSLTDAGSERGTFFKPEIGDEVLIGFINSDPRFPVVLGMLNSSAHPAVMPATDDNHEKGIVTRAPLKIWFNDDKKQIEISTPSGKMIVLDEEADAIQLKDDHGNEIIMNSDGISISSAKDLVLKASGDVTIEGVGITAEASASATFKGGSAAEFSSGGTTTVKGSLVNVN